MRKSKKIAATWLGLVLIGLLTGAAMGSPVAAAILVIVGGFVALCLTFAAIWELLA